MNIIETKGAFAAAHVISNHQGKCQNLHGHNYVVEVIMAKEDLDESGMVEDFGGINDIINSFDHTLIVNSNTTDARESRLADICKRELGYHVLEIPYRVTAENLARHIWKLLSTLCDFSYAKVTVWETEKHKAVYTGCLRE